MALSKSFTLSSISSTWPIISRMLASLGNQLQDDPLCPRRLHHQECIHLNRLWEAYLHIDKIRKGELITELCFVVAGSLEVVQDGEILAFLGRCIKLNFASRWQIQKQRQRQNSRWRDPCFSWKVVGSLEALSFLWQIQRQKSGWRNSCLSLNVLIKIFF